MPIKPTLPFVETMLTYGCNLSCQGCTNYSDYNVGGLVSWEQGRVWIKSWVERVDITDFGLIGGEPLMNPQVVDWIRGCRELMPNSQIRFTTNAILLKKHPEVIQALMDIGNCVIKLSLHQPQEFYTQETLRWLFNIVNWYPLEEYGIKRWGTANKVRLQINFPQQFVKTFQGEYTNMLPHHSNPDDSYKICVQQTCPLLYNGVLYKCSSIALLNKVLTDWNHVGNSAWQPYLDYQGIDPNCTHHQLNAFLEDFGKPESICSMCPTKNDQDSILPHHSTTITKIAWIHNNVSPATTRNK
jgi:hypothetical protein